MAHIAGSTVRSRFTTLFLPLALLFAVALAGATRAAAADEHPFLADLSLPESFVEACGATTDPYGNFYVADLEGGVSVFDPIADPIAEFMPFELGGVFSGCSLAVDRVGAVYLTAFDFPANNEVAKYSPVGGEFPPTASTEYELDETAGDEGVIVERGANAVAVDPETRELFVAEAGINEQQELVLPTAAQCSPGTMLELTYVPTGQISADELVCGVQEGPLREALQAMLGAENVTARGPAVTKTIEFTGALGNIDIPAGAIEAREVGTGTLRATSTAKADGVASGISVYSPAGASTGQKIGAGIPAAAYFGIDVDAAADRLYAVDQQNAVVDVFDLAGATATLTATVDGADRYSSGFGDLRQSFVAADEASGTFYVNNVGLSLFEDPTSANGVIAQFTPAGEFVSEIGPTFGEEEVEFESEIYAPIGLTVDDGACSPNRGNVYVAANWENLYAFGPTSPFTPTAPEVTAVEPSEGPTAGGNTVTVTETELGCADLPGGAVEFGDTPATDVEVDATGSEFTVTVPAHAAGTVDVTVTTPNGSSSPTVADEYTYVAPSTLPDPDPDPVPEPEVEVEADADPPPAPSAPPAPTPEPAGKPRLAGESARVSEGKATVRLSCPGPGSCAGLLRLTMRVGKNGRARMVSIGSTRFALAEGETRTVKVRLSAAARKRLAKQGKVTVRVSGGSVNATLTLRPPR